MIGGDVTITGDKVLEQSDGGIEGDLDAEFGAIGAPNVDVNGVRGLRILNGTVASHGMLLLPRCGRLRFSPNK